MLGVWKSAVCGEAVVLGSLLQGGDGDGEVNSEYFEVFLKVLCYENVEQVSFRR